MPSLEALKTFLGEKAAEETEAAQAARGGGPGDPQYARIICPEHGPVFLSEADYWAQMRNPDARWVCHEFCTSPPEAMGPCGAICEFDDDYFDAKHFDDELTADQ